MKTFTVKGAPVPKGRPRVVRRGKHVTTYTPDKTVAYERLVAATALASGVRQLTGPVRVAIVLHMPDARARDIDNLAKAILDGLNRVAYSDDRQVEALEVRRRIDRANPRAVVTVGADVEAEPSEPFDADDHSGREFGRGAPLATANSNSLPNSGRKAGGR